MSIARRIPVTMMVALSVGCTLGPDYARPALEIPAQHRGAPPAPGTPADLQGWTPYTDRALQELIARALARNLDVRIAAARIEQARAALGVSGLRLLPQIGGTAAVERRQNSADTAAVGVERLRSTESLELGLSWELDLWGRLRREREAAHAEFLAAQHAQRGVWVGLVADVASAWFGLGALDQQLRIARGTAKTRQQFLQLTRAQFERGVVSGLDVSNAESQLATARASIPEFERRIAQTEHALSLLLGDNPGPVPRAGVVTALPPIPLDLPSDLLQRRPDLLAAEQALVAANARVGSARAALFPSLSLTASLGSLSTGVSDLLGAPAETWSLGVNLLQPILDADRNAYLVDLADARKTEALAQYEKTVRIAFAEVADALVDERRYREVEAAQATQVAALTRAEGIASARYEVGYSSYFDVINADRELFNAKLALAAARLNSQLSRVRLYRALGGGWAVLY